ncbi:MAG: hypothetical protein LBQ79_09905 [Deltaproteobacteria bacterium]|jgi:hypothetical protein|nr:hypothetical protein [Deltaproteobacteria bacterium]
MENVPTSEKNELIMMFMDRFFSANPCYGCRRITAVFNRLPETPGDMKLIRDEGIAVSYVMLEVRPTSFSSSIVRLTKLKLTQQII